MRPITGIRTVSVPVRDQDTAIDFFVDVLGFEVRFDTDASPGIRWVEVAVEDCDVTIALSSASESGVDTGVRFVVGDAEGAHAAIADHGGVVSDIIRWDGVPPMFTFHDPDGNRFYAVEEQR